MDIGKRREVVKPFTATYDGEEIHGEFRPGALTGAMVSSVMDAPQGRQTEAMAEALAETLVSWDTTLNGGPYPPTRDNLMGIEPAVLTAVFEGIGEANRPNGGNS